MQYKIYKMIIRLILYLWITQLMATETPFQSILDQISADSIEKHVRFLGSDNMQGRATGTPGAENAAAYIALHLQHYGMLPIGVEQSYFQPIPMHGSIPLPESQLQIVVADKKTAFELKRDYLLFKSGAQTFIPQPVPLVFVGYGIIAPEFDYNDYQTINVTGKIVVYLSGEPPSSDPAYFNGKNPTIYAYPEVKQRIALSRGARGSIMLPNLREENERNWRYWVDTFEFEDVTLAYAVSGNFSMVMNPNPAQRLFDGAAHHLHQVYEMEATNTIRSFPLKSRASFRGKFIERDFFASNVIGMLPGKNRRPNDTYIIMSAHYDHLGIGRPVKGDSIYNGVLDNAIGVAAVLEIARVFYQQKAVPVHSLIFLFTVGEEKGLLGSTYYVDNPVVPLYKTLANINVDGIAAFLKFRDIIGVGTDYSSLESVFYETGKKLQMVISEIPQPFLKFESFARSDQISFAKAGIPAVLISEGYHYENMSAEEGLERIYHWMEQFYHTPFDDLHQPLNFAAARQHCQVIAGFCWELANQKKAPEWKPGTPYINARLRSIAEKK